MKNSSHKELKINPFAVKTPENLSPSELVDLFVPYPEYENLQISGHQFLNGHRGSGKSMMLRMMSPSCQRLALNVEFLNDLPYIGVYLSIKATEINLPEYERLKDELSGFVMSEHVLVTKLLSALFVSLQECFMEWPTASIDVKSLKKFSKEIFVKRLSYVGWSGDVEWIEGNGTVSEYLTSFIDVFDEIQAETTAYIKRRSFSKEYVAFEGPLMGFQDVLLAIIKGLSKYEIMPERPVYFLLDDADNLTEQQTEILNTWVSYRSTDIVSLKISTQMNYKTKRTSSGLAIEAPHDYSDINFTSVYTGSVKENYPKLIGDIVKRRLDQFGLVEVSPELFFPEDKEQASEIQRISEEIRQGWASAEKGGYRAGDDVYRYARPEYIRRLSEGTTKQGYRYRYSGFEQLVHISSGIIRFFLEPAARMYADQLKINEGQPVSFIHPSIQDDEIRKQSDELLIDQFQSLQDDVHKENGPEAVRKIEQLRNIVNALGSLFQAHIMDENQTQRRVFSFTISDNPPREVEEILRMGVRFGYFYEDVIGKKSGMGRERLYVLTRRLAPAFKLDPVGFSNYLPVTSGFLLDVAANPARFINRLRKEGAEKAVGAYAQGSLFEVVIQ